MTTVALSIAGSDPSGGAGIQADLKTFHAHGVFGTAVVSLVTVQNTLGVRRVEMLDPQLVAEQLEAVLDDVPPAAIKTGALGCAEIIEAVMPWLERSDVPLVVDPVLASTSGAVLLDAGGMTALQKRLFARASLVTPNLDEASLLLGQRIASVDDMRDAARTLVRLGPAAALVKGGHLAGDPVDVLCVDGAVHELHAPRVAARGAHGLGCTLSAAITARLACGDALLDACRGAKTWLSRALASAPGLGAGRGPVNHLEPLGSHGAVPRTAHGQKLRSPR